MLGVVLVLAAALFAAAGALAWRRLVALRGSRRAQYDLLYARVGEMTANNYGFSPSPLVSPERFQLQMYDELWQLLEKRGFSGPARVLEISCGRGGGLAHLAGRHGSATCIGLDFSRVAIAFCSTRHAGRSGLHFLAGDALQLPFPAGGFDVVIDVEASNQFGDAAPLFREVVRVLRPGGAFLYADSRLARKVPLVAETLERAGLHGELRDVTENVRRSCEEDTPRRLRLLDEALPWPLRRLLAARLESYAGVSGSRMHEKFRARRRVYFMGCLEKPGGLGAPAGALT